MMPQNGYMTTSIVSDFWATIYAGSFGWDWEILAQTADPFDPNDDSRYIRDSDVVDEHECSHPYVAPDYVDNITRCVDCDEHVITA